MYIEVHRHWAAKGLVSNPNESIWTKCIWAKFAFRPNVFEPNAKGLASGAISNPNQNQFENSVGR